MLHMGYKRTKLIWCLRYIVWQYETNILHELMWNIPQWNASNTGTYKLTVIEQEVMFIELNVLCYFICDPQNHHVTMSVRGYVGICNQQLNWLLTCKQEDLC